MTPEEQRIAIAEACEWTNCHHNPAKGEPRGYLPKESFLGEFTLPDYLNDLNAMYEAEKHLSDEQHSDFIRELFSIVNKAVLAYPHIALTTELWRIANATASQRAEAFLRTLNLWKL